MQRSTVTKTIESILGKDLLTKARGIDVVANGVQLQGSEHVQKVAFGVTAHMEFFKQAVEWGADYCVFHHGLDLRTYQGCYPTFLQEQLAFCFHHQLTVSGYHFSLDAHPTLGNNVQLLHHLGASKGDTCYDDWGFYANYDNAISLQQLIDRLNQVLSKPVQVFFAENSNDQEIRSIAVCTGFGKPNLQHLQEFLNTGVQVYISGESTESTPHKLTESGISYILGGHYATEVFGVQALQAELQSQLGDRIETKFIDTPTGL